MEILTETLDVVQELQPYFWIFVKIGAFLDSWPGDGVSPEHIHSFKSGALLGA